MKQNQKQVSANGPATLILVLICAIGLKEGYTGSAKWYWVLIAGLPLLMLVIQKIRQSR